MRTSRACSVVLLAVLACGPAIEELEPNEFVAVPIPDGGQERPVVDADVPDAAVDASDAGDGGVGCGGPNLTVPRCEDGSACASGSDCASAFCNRAGTCATPTITDGEKNLDETDVDCGGATAPKCDAGKACALAADCASQVCGRLTPKICDAPAFDDEVKNGTETDVDCGGDPAHPCLVGKVCIKHSDCASDGCNHAGRCVSKRSCVGSDGGDTCRKEDGATESCCTTISVPANAFSGAAFEIDKYLTTAGRMRSFLTRVKGDVRGYITTNKPAWWQDEWTPWLPVSFNGHENDDYAQPVVSTTVKGWAAGEFTVDVNGAVTSVKVPAHDLVLNHVNVASAWAQVGGAVIYDQGSQGCYIGDGGYGHPTYLVPRDDASALYGDGYERWISQAALDQRPINCTNWPVLAALCAFDGGRLINEKQYAYVYDDDGAVTGDALAGGRSMYPWGTPPAMTCAGGICTPGAGYDRVNKPHVGGYAYIDPPDVAGAAKEWTLVGPGGPTGFTSNVCRDCDDSWVNWQFSYQDPLWDPWAAGFNAAEQERRSRDQSYFISVPGSHPKGASRAFGGDRVQDIAALMYEAAIPSSGTYSSTNTFLTFGTDDPSDDVAVVVPTVLLYGGSFEGHNVGASGSYRLVTKYGKMTARCVY